MHGHEFFPLITNPYSRRARSFQNAANRPKAWFLCPEHDSHKGGNVDTRACHSIVAKCLLSRTVFDTVPFCIGHTYDSHQREKGITVTAAIG